MSTEKSVGETPEVLVVDDDRGLLQLMTLRLQSLGYQSRTVESAADAMIEIRRRRPSLVVTDLRMDGMDGLSLLALLQEEWPGLPVIILTAHGTISEAVAATQQGAFAFLTKPVEKEALQTTLQNALQTYSTTGCSEFSPSRDLLPGFTTRSSRLFGLLEQARLVAKSDVNVLIEGESGSGKEVLAQAIHRASIRAEAPFVPINCGALPADLMESELFGHKRGAFTGATRDYQGLIASADGGTLFLDEIGDMPLALQVKLLRVLQERQIRPVGGDQSLQIDIRVIAATHRPLLQMVESQRFREDLYYRLNVVNFHIPPLRERPEDIHPLLQQALTTLAERQGQAPKTVAPEAMALLVDYHWPGNVRQLNNFAEKCQALCPGPVITREIAAQTLHGPAVAKPSVGLTDAKREFERAYIEKLLTITHGNLPEAARLAERNRSDFFKIVKKHGIDPELYRR